MDDRTPPNRWSALPLALLGSMLGESLVTLWIRRLPPGQSTGVWFVLTLACAMAGAVYVFCRFPGTLRFRSVWMIGYVLLVSPLLAIYSILFVVVAMGEGP